MGGAGIAAGLAGGLPAPPFIVTVLLVVGLVIYLRRRK